MRASRCILPGVLLAALAAAAGAADQVPITEIEVQGVRTQAELRIVNVTTVRAGRSYHPGDLQAFLADDVKAIERMGPFAGTRTTVVPGAEPGRAKIIYTVEELPLVAYLGFGDRDQWDEDDLRKAIATRKGGYANPLIIENDRVALERKLKENGHRYATVAVAREAMPGGIRLDFIIDEGPEVQVGRLVLEGLPKGAKPKLFDPGPAMPQGLLNAVGRPYTPEFVELDRGAIAAVLQDEGWLDCRVDDVLAEVADYVRPLDPRARGGPRIVPDGEHDDRVVLRYAITPGERWKLGEVSFVGNTVAGNQALHEAFAMEEGSWFRKAEVRRAVERARRVISNQGYARCRVTPDRRLDYATRTVHLVLRFDEGRQYRIGRVDFAGNAGTRDPVVRRAMRLHPGDWWNDDRKDESQRQILRTGIFKDDPRSPLSVEPRFPDDRPDEADLLVRLDEDPSGSLSFQLGFSSAVGFFGQLSYTERNFDLLGALGFEAWRGANQTLELTGSVSEDRTSVGTTWTNPHVADGPYSLSASGSRSDSSLRDWDEVRLSGSVGIGRAFLNDDLRVGLSYGYTDIEVDRILDRAPDDAREGSYFMNTLGLNLSYDRLNNPRLPTSGWALSAGDTLYGEILPSSPNFHEGNAKAEGMVPFYESEDGGDWFLRAATRWRQAWPTGSVGVPFYQRFLGGGPGPRHRGFEYNRLSPRKTNAKGFLTVEGGVTDLVSTLEFSIPLQGTDDGLRAVAFSDWGNVWGDDEPIRLADIRTAYGFGVRFPMQFPIALDFAWLLNPRGGEAESQIHFGIGQFRF